MYLDQNNDTSKLLQYAIIGGVAYLFFKGTIVKAIRGHEKSSVEYNASSGNIHSQQALIIAQALNPSGSSWLRNTDGTDEQLLYNTYQRITDYAQVSREYEKLTNRSLEDDLKRELSSNDYQTLKNLLDSTKTVTEPNGTVVKNPYSIRQGSIIVTIRDTNVRSNPDAKSNGIIRALFDPKSGAKITDIVDADLYKNNIIEVVGQGGFVGLATGNSAYDKDRGVKFIEVVFGVLNHKSLPTTLRKYVGKNVLAYITASSNHITAYNDKVSFGNAVMRGIVQTSDASWHYKKNFYN